MPKTALLLLSERGYEIECDKVFGRVCDKRASFEIKLNDNATREDPLSFEAHEKVNVSGAFCSIGSNYSQSRHPTIKKIGIASNQPTGFYSQRFLCHQFSNRNRRPEHS